MTIHWKRLAEEGGESDCRIISTGGLGYTLTRISHQLVTAAVKTGDKSGLRLDLKYPD